MVGESIQSETVNESSETTGAPSETVEKPNDEKKGNYYQKKLAEVLAEKESLASQLESERKAKLVEQNNYKELYELEKGKRSQAEDHAKKISESYVNDLKSSAIKQAALKAGIHETALEDLAYLPNDMVQVETTSTGNINILGTEEYVDYLKNKKPHLFRMGNSLKVNNSHPSEIKPKELTPQDVLKLQKENPAAYRAWISKRLGKV
jgi:hypothetical protein